MKDVSPNTQPHVVRSFPQDSTVVSENTVYQFPAADKWKVTSKYKIWEVSERALKKHKIID